MVAEQGNLVTGGPTGSYLENTPKEDENIAPKHESGQGKFGEKMTDHNWVN